MPLPAVREYGRFFRCLPSPRGVVVGQFEESFFANIGVSVNSTKSSILQTRSTNAASTAGVVFNVGQSRVSSVLHSDVEVLALRVARGNVRIVWRAHNLLTFRSEALGRAVSRVWCLFRLADPDYGGGKAVDEYLADVLMKALDKLVNSN